MQYVVDKNGNLFVEIDVNEDMNIPKAVLAIPFVGIMLTAAMLLDMSIRVESLDKKFYESLKNIECAFRSIYRTDKIKFQVLSQNIVDCSYFPENKKLFSSRVVWRRLVH